jgi:phosphoenolpyruvate---glycerone phosphotransferase subunit DhaK
MVFHLNNLLEAQWTFRLHYLLDTGQNRWHWRKVREIRVKKLQNDKTKLVEDALSGYALAHQDIIRLVSGTHMIERVREKKPGHVRVMIGNGAGHEPAVICLVGEGIFDLNVVGDVFSAPSARAIYEGIKRLAKNGPVLLAVQNHAGDVLNTTVAMQMAEKEGLPVRSVLFYDDVASAPKGMESERRGMAGMIFYTKIIGAMAENGADINDIIDTFQRVRDRTRTVSVAITNCTHPVSGLSMFDSLSESEIEIGMGVHGEGGTRRVSLPKSRDLAKILCDQLVADGEYKPQNRILVFVNGSGGITMMELSTFYADVRNYLESLGLSVVDCKVGNYLTTQELSGVSLSLISIDDTLLSLWKAPCSVSQF